MIQVVPEKLICHAHELLPKPWLGNSRCQCSRFKMSIRILHNFERTQNFLDRFHLSFCFTGFVTIFIWRVVNIPVKRLVIGTQEIVKGNLDYHIDVQASNEIGSLGMSFNQMTLELKTRTDRTDCLDTNTGTACCRKDRRTSPCTKTHGTNRKMVSLGTLAATVAHELNNPLEGILTYAKLLRKKIEAWNSIGGICT